MLLRYGTVQYNRELELRDAESAADGGSAGEQRL
jgi:hypothetical protein